MSNLTKMTRGNWGLNFYLKGVRKWIYFSKNTPEEALANVKNGVDGIVNCKNNGWSLSSNLIDFIEKAPPPLYKKLVRAGLVDNPKPKTLRGLCAAFLTFKQHSGIGDSTFYNYEKATKRLLRFFGDDRDPGSLEKADILNWIAWLSASEKQAETSTFAHVRDAKALFRWAMDENYVKKNPCKGVNIPYVVPDDRYYHVTESEYRALLEACPNTSWKAYIALCRVGGMRRSESFDIKWSDVLWSEDNDLGFGQLMVHASKTKWAGKGLRPIPMHVEVEATLKELRDENKPTSSDELVLIHILHQKLSAYYHIKKIMKKAGLEWDKPFQNLRVSKDNDYSDGGVSDPNAERWQGHTGGVRRRHYLGATPEQIKKAVNLPIQ